MTTAIVGRRACGDDATVGDGAGAFGEVKPRLALVDPRPLIRESVFNLLRAAATEFEVRACARADCINNEGVVSLIILAVGTASVRNTFIAREICLLRELVPDALLAILSDRDGCDEVKAALELGIRGFIPTSVDARVAVSALRLVHAGGTYVPTTAIGLAPAAMQGASASASLPQNTAEHPQPRSNALSGVTGRERDVLELLCKGFSNKLIANHLSMQESTVKVHIHRIMKKLQVHNRTELAVRTMAESL